MSLFFKLSVSENKVMVFSSQYYIMVCLFIILAIIVGCDSGSGDADDPVIDTLPIVYIERTHLVESVDNSIPSYFEDDRVEPALFFPGAKLMLRSGSDIGASAEHIFATKLCQKQPQETAIFTQFCNVDRSVKPYDVKDIAVSYDAQTLVFAVRPPAPDNNDEPTPTWDLWTYSFETQMLAPVGSSQGVFAVGDEIAPEFLPDGDLIFSSNVQQRTRALLLDENKFQYQALDEARRVTAFMLHRMDLDGNNPTQLTFNMSHDLDPAVLPSGRIIFSRWDNLGSVNRVNLYTMKPDGSDVQIHYGAHSHDGAGGSQQEFFKSKVADDGRLFVQYSVKEPDFFGTRFLLIDAENYTDRYTPVYANTGATGPAQTMPAGFESQSTQSFASFAHASPLRDGTGRVLAVWSPCRLTHLSENNVNDTDLFLPCTAGNLANTELVQAPPLYGLWMFNTIQGSQTLIEAGSENMIATEAIVVAPRTRESIILPVSASTEYVSSAADENLAVLHIRSVYDIAGLDTSVAGIGVLADPLQTEPTARPHLFMRIVKGVRIPSRDVKPLINADFGVSRLQLMRELIGYTPVEPDGSVKVLVPAEVPLMISFLNSEGERTTARHQSWLEFAPGEVYECRGCHLSTSDQSVHGRRDAEPPSANNGAAANMPFINTGADLIADVGESMAETWSRINGVRRPTIDLVFNDDWTDPLITAPAAAFTLSHDDLVTSSPLSTGCRDINGDSLWSPLCRVQIHYPVHIEPLWSLEREGIAADGVTLENQTCVHCHSRLDNVNQIQVPAGQLELSADPSPEQARHTISYRELLTNDEEIEVRNGALQDVLIPVVVNGEQVPVLDQDGEPVIDGDGMPVVEMMTIVRNRSMNSSGSRSSQVFFNTMTGHTVTSVDHSGYLSEAELLLIREWLDMGAQYYNDPFAVPEG